MHKMIYLFVAVLSAQCLVPMTVPAGEMQSMRESILNQDLQSYDPWQDEGFEVSFTTGLFTGPSFGVEGARGEFNYWANSFRFAYNLTGIIADGTPFRGNVQFVGELFLAEIFNTDGGGSIVVGPNALFRYNFVQPNWFVVPYIQLGSGLVYTDTNNTAIGSEFLFQSNIGVGLRWMLNDRWAITTEFDWHHMSNAGLAERNLGSNEAGYQMGVSYFFF